MSKLAPITPPVISTMSRYSAMSDYFQMTSAGVSLLARTWTANLAIYIPFWLPWPYPVKRIFFQNGTAAGNNHDVGIYTWEGKRIYSTGPVLSTAGNNNPQYAAVDFLLSPGWYYFAYCHNTATANRAFGSSGVSVLRAREVGLFQEATAAGTLPPTATFATYASGLMMHCGITRLTAGN